MASITRALGLDELRGSMKDLLYAGAGAAGLTLGSDFLLNNGPDFIKNNVNGTYLEPIAHAVMGAAGYVLVKKTLKNDAAALGAASAGMAMALMTAYQFISGNKAAKPIQTSVPSVAGLGIFSDALSQRKLLLSGGLGAAPTTYEQLGMVSIEEGPYHPAAQFMGG